MNLNQQLVQLDKIKREVALVQTVPEAKDLHDRAEALRLLVKKAGLHLDIQNLCAEARLRVEYRGGELLRETVRPGNPQLSHGVTIGKLPEGISRMQSSRWQKVASLPPEMFDGHIAETKDKHKELTTASVLKLATVLQQEQEKAAILKCKVDPVANIIWARMEDALPRLPESSVDLIVTDPPYGLGETSDIKFSERADMSVSKGDWDRTTSYAEWVSHFSRVLKADASIYVFVSNTQIGNLWAALSLGGFKVRNLITWHKTNPAPSVRKRCFGHACEYILFATVGGEYTFNWLGQNQMHDFAECPICQGKERLGHPTQKPIRLLRHFIEISSNRGDTVLDPFAGVGSAGAAAAELERGYILIEEDEIWYKKTCIRLQG